jgi:non-ribosomal peptide synthetase-like protein
MIHGIDRLEIDEATADLGEAEIGNSEDVGAASDDRAPAPILVGAAFADEGRPGERLNTLFEQLAERFGSQSAVIDAGRTWSYRELDARANQLARLLIERGVLPGSRIGLLLDRSADTYVALLAVMKARAAYVPLAVAFPEERMAFILDDADVTFLVSIGAHKARVERLGVPFVLVDAASAEIDAKSNAPLLPDDVAATTDKVCYILYTSGTTGKPKGVVIEHQSICNFVRVAAAAYGYRPGDRVYQGMTIAFDFSVEEIWVPFAAGATLMPAPGELTLIGEELADFLRDNAVTCMACSPTLLSSIESDVPNLRLILVGGEACPHGLVERWAKPGRKILNTYGPTEATVTASMGVLTPDQPVTIGVPLPTYSIVILDPAKPELAAPGELGEIGIAGIGLAAGYLNRPDLTQQKFIPDFLNLPSNPSKRIYRTGDLGRVDDTGRIDYRGRIDTQVKIRGNRIELGEIEAVLLEQDAIGQAVVTTIEAEPGRVELVAYYVIKSGASLLSPTHIGRELKRRLPDYMVPAYLEELPAIPMTVSDKVDYRQLPKPTGPRSAADRRMVPPANDDQRLIVAALSTVLNREDVSIDDHFFDDLGANSLLMARFCARLRTKEAWATASMRDIYLHPTVERLAKYLSREAQPAAPKVAEPSHEASALAYWTCGAAQLSFLALYSYCILWVLNRGLDWVYEMLDEPEWLYLRCAVLAGGIFFGMSAVAIVAKWLLIGRWKPETFPIWGLRYYRFWVVTLLVRGAPVVLFKGSPLYSLYLKLLGARLGRNTVIECRSVPVCTDLIAIGDNTILRKDSSVLGYRAQSGFIHTGPVTVGHGAFVGEASVLDIYTAIGDGAQLGHSSSLQSGQSVPAGESWHGSPAVSGTADYCKVPNVTCSKIRRVIYEAVQIVGLLAVITPLPLLFLSYWQWVSDDFEETVGALVIAATITLFGGLAILLLGAVAVSRLVRPILRPGKTYSLYGLHHWLQTAVARTSNSRLLNLIFGDSSAVVHYIRAIGWKLNEVEQTGSNFGTNQQHDNPLLCEIGSRTMVSDGLSMINMYKSASSFRLEYTKVGERNYLGNNIYYPPDGRTGANCLLGTKVMIPVDGPMRENVGLLGSPAFEIPRIVDRDKALIGALDKEERRKRVAAKNVHNFLTVVLFLESQWVILFLTMVIWDRALNYYSEWGAKALFVAMVLTMVISISFYAFLERASIGFRRLKPQVATIYDSYFWFHERHWKLSDSPIVGLFAGTPFRPMILRLLGVKVGRRVYDGGSIITERSLVEIGDGATLNESCVLQPHSLEEGAFKSDVIRIGRNATLGPAAFVHYGVTVGDGASVDADSFVMKGEMIEPHTAWRGNPAKLHRLVVPVGGDAAEAAAPSAGINAGLARREEAA